MNRILLLMIGVSTGMWMLRDIVPVDELTVCCWKQVSAPRNLASQKAVPPRPKVPAVLPSAVEVNLPAVPPALHKAQAIKTVAYDEPVEAESPLSETDSPDLGPPPADEPAGDRAALGKWASGVLGSLLQKPAAATAAAMHAMQIEQASNGSAEQPAEHISQRNSSALPTTVPQRVPQTAAPTTAPNVLATDEPVAETPTKTAVKPTEKPADTERPADIENPADVEKPTAVEKPADTAKPTDTEKPAVTAAAPEDTLGTDDKPAAAADSAATSPSATSPTALPPAILPQAAAPAPVQVAPVRQPLTPELTVLWQKVHYALAMYQHERLLNTGKHVPWEVMHRVVAFGGATEILRDGPGGEPVNAIGWLLWGGRCKSQPLLVLSGGRPLALIGVGVQGHAGQFLGMLAQSHVRPESPFQLQGQRFTVRDLIEQEKLSCEANTELTFELIAMSYYAKTDDVWTARTGEQWSIARLVHEEIKQPIQGAACGGSHRLFGLSSAYKKRIAEGKPVDGEFLRAQKYIRAYQNYTLGTIENRDGSFSTDWFQRRADNGDLDRKIQTTGHILEWLVFSLDDSQLRDPRVVRSVDFLATQIETYPNRAWSVGPLGHALHALAIYESRVFVQPVSESQEQAVARRAATAPQALMPRQAVMPRQATLPQQASVPPTARAEPARSLERPAVRPAARPTIGTPNAAASTAELDGPDLGVTR